MMKKRLAFAKYGFSVEDDHGNILLFNALHGTKSFCKITCKDFENINYDLRCIADIYRFLTAVNQISQNLNKADRQFTQIPELNAGSYHVPIKLTAYYSVFIYKVKEEE